MGFVVGEEKKVLQQRKTSAHGIEDYDNNNLMKCFERREDENKRTQKNGQT